MGMKKKILSALLELRRQVHMGNYPCTGICNFVDTFVDTFVDNFTDYYEHQDYCHYCLSQAIRQWPKFSGDRTYPVPCGDMRPECAYDVYSCGVLRGRWMWESAEYGMVRRELLDFLIEHFEKQVAAEAVDWTLQCR
jgi:hypothetical protein